MDSKYVNQVWRRVVAIAGLLALILSGLTGPQAASTASAAGQTPAHTVTYDGYSFLVDGTRTYLWSGEFHYFRLPSPDLWLDIFQKMKAAGFNATSLYFDWGYHSPRPGVYDFSGVRDVDKLLDMAQQAGLYVIARPAPYINAEVDGGGLPGWMSTMPGKNRSASLADVGCLLTSWSAVSSDSEMPASSSGTGVRAAVTTTCCAGAATLSLTTKLCSSAAIAFIAGANPGASTCTPSSWAEIPLKLASPEPAVFWLATTLLPLRILTCAPATGRASRSTTETLISALQAQKAVETKTKKILGTKEKEREKEKEKLENTAHPPLHAKGLMERIAPVSWLARAIAASLPAA